MPLRSVNVCELEWPVAGNVEPSKETLVDIKSLISMLRLAAGVQYLRNARYLVARPTMDVTLSFEIRKIEHNAFFAARENSRVHANRRARFQFHRHNFSNGRLDDSQFFSQTCGFFRDSRSLRSCCFADEVVFHDCRIGGRAESRISAEYNEKKKQQHVETARTRNGRDSPQIRTTRLQ